MEVLKRMNEDLYSDKLTQQFWKAAVIELLRYGCQQMSRTMELIWSVSIRFSGALICFLKQHNESFYSINCSNHSMESFNRYKFEYLKYSYIEYQSVLSFKNVMWI